MSPHSRLVAGIVLIIVPTVEIGGASILSLLIADPAYAQNDLRGSFAKRRWVRKGAPQSVGAGLWASIWWPFAVKLWCQSGVRPITKLSLRGC